jgi:hypothetical protein
MKQPGKRARAVAYSSLNNKFLFFQEKSYVDTIILVANVGQQDLHTVSITARC